MCALYVFQTLVEPFRSVAVGRLDGNEGEGVSQVEFARIDEAAEAAVQFVVEDEGVGCREARHVEGLAGRHEGDGVEACFFGDGGKGPVAVGREREVGVYFVGEDGDTLFCADVSHLLQFRFAPYESAGVVRMAEDEGAASSDRLPESVEVHVRPAVAPAQRMAHHLLAVALAEPGKGVIDRRLNHDAVARLRQGIDGHADARHNARHVVDVFPPDGQSVAFAVPADNGFIIAVVLCSIAENGMQAALAQGFGYEGGGGEVHVGHPERQQVRASPVFGHAVNFDGGCSVPVNPCVEIVFHSQYFYPWGWAVCMHPDRPLSLPFYCRQR